MASAITQALALHATSSVIPGLSVSLAQLRTVAPAAVLAMAGTLCGKWVFEF
jgi:hypothetical protein